MIESQLAIGVPGILSPLRLLLEARVDLRVADGVALLEVAQKRSKENVCDLMS
ncbi:MAG: hypothetical protein ACPGVU_09550 [Limisphaerales bacterium]